MKILRALALVLLGTSLAMADAPITFELDTPRQAGSAALADPDTGLVTNSAIDIIEHNGGVWLGTGKGVMFSYDNGQTWLRYDASNGLVSSNLSAIFSAPDGRLWIGSNHDEEISGQLFSLSDGVSYTDDNGDTWVQIDFSPGGQDIEFVTGGNRQVFDITGLNDPELGGDWLFFSAFAGGLLASQDGGDNWRRIFPTSADSTQFYIPGVQPSLRNRYFSCVADTAHQDSVFMWAGTAAGVFQYVWVKPEDKFYSRSVRAVAFCDTCTVDSERSLFIGGNNGLTRGQFTGGPFDTRFESDGLPDAFITALGYFWGRLLIGGLDLGSLEPSLAYSDDHGETFTDITPSFLTGVSDSISSFVGIDDRVYMTAGTAGLWVSSDTGLTWARILVDSANPGSALNAVNALESIGDTLRIGTDSGYASVELDASGAFVAPPFINADTADFGETLRRSRRVVGIRTQQIGDTSYIWAICLPATAQGTAVTLQSEDGGANWLGRLVDTVMTDLEVVNDTLYAVGWEGIFYNTDGQLTNIIPGSITASGTSLAGDSILTLAVRDSQLVFGTNTGMAISTEPDTLRTYAIYRANFDTLRADLAINYNSTNTIIVDTGGVRVGITGDFIPAMDVQYRNGAPPRIWASGRPVSGGGNGIAVGRFEETELVDTLGNVLDTTVSLRWRGVNLQHFAWNYAFDDEVVFAATDAGLLMKDMAAPDSLEATWDTIQFITDENVFVEPGTPVYSVAVIDNYLWAGTDDGTVRLDLFDFTDQQRFHYRDLEAPTSEVYAFPTPFRPGRGEEVDFHFTVEQDATVTLDIFDFAMNHVATPIDNVFFPADTYHGGGSSGAQGITWDGYNDDGDLVAVGVYYFKVTYSTGEVRWGKLAVIP